MFEEIGGAGAHAAGQAAGDARHFWFHKTETLDYAIVLEGKVLGPMDKASAAWGRATSSSSAAPTMPGRTAATGPVVSHSCSSMRRPMAVDTTPHHLRPDRRFHGKAATPALPSSRTRSSAGHRRLAGPPTAYPRPRSRWPQHHRPGDLPQHRWRLCEHTDAIVQLTTGAGLTQTYEQRLGTALRNPEMCSLNMGFVLFFTPDGRALMLDSP